MQSLIRCSRLILVAAALFGARTAASQCDSAASSGWKGSIRGSVVDMRQNPVSGAQIMASWRSWDVATSPSGRGSADAGIVERANGRTTRSDASGRYELCGIPTLVQLSLRALHGARESAEHVFVASDSLPVALDLTVGADRASETFARVGYSGAAHGRAAIAGRVLDAEGTAAVGVRLHIEGAGAVALSDADGRFQLSGLPEGEQILTARRIGFRPQSVPVPLSATSPAEITLILTPIPVMLSEVVRIAPRSAFEVESNGFSERRRRGPGVFLDRADIERRKPHLMSDLLRTVPGMRLQPVDTRWGQSVTATMDRVPDSFGRACQIDFFVNGQEYTPTSMGIDNDVPAQQIEAIEVYKPSEIPAQFLGSRSRCGVVVIWTRYRAHELSRD